MKRNLRYIGILCLAVILSGCGRASEGAPAETPTETLADLTETETDELSTTSEAVVETSILTTTTLPETTEATTETTEAPTESEPTDRPPQLFPGYWDKSRSKLPCAVIFSHGTLTVTS